MVIVAIPLMILGFYGIRRHYERVKRRLAAGAAAVVAAPAASNSTLLVVEALDDATDLALWFARTISGGDFRAVHVPRADADPGIRPRWFRRVDGTPQLEVLDERLGLGDAMLEQVWRLPRGESDFVTVVVPEEFRRRSLWEVVRNRSELMLKFRLLSEPGVVVADVPTIADRRTPLPERIVARVLVAGVDAASMRAVNYATTLGIADTKAVHFAFSGEHGRTIRRDWSAQGPRLTLEVDEAPYRDIGGPLLGYLRRLTAEPGTAVLVLLPELIVPGWRRLLHNQRALYIKRLLLLEPGVILASVPYQLLR